MRNLPCHVAVFVQAFKPLTMSIMTFGSDSTFNYALSITPSTPPRRVLSETPIDFCQEPAPPRRRCQDSQTKDQLLTPRPSLGSEFEINANANVKTAQVETVLEAHNAGKYAARNVVDHVLQAIRVPGPNGIVEIQNAMPVMYDLLTEALDEVKGISLHYDAALSKIIVYGPPSLVHDNVAINMRSLAEAASNEVKEAYHIRNEPHFCMGFAMDLKGDEGGLQQKMPDFSFAICQEDGVLDTRHCVVVEVAYT